MQYAIVDIETTGGFPQEHGITEIAIVLYNGMETEGKYETLVNPHQPIPPFVVNMTGITDAMVAVAPSFHEVAPKIYTLLKDRVFVAHNVNFDYSFVKYHLQQAGFVLQSPKLCTIRLSRKVFPGFRKYGLDHLCRELDIQIENRHRAGGDAMATTWVLDLVLRNNGSLLVKEMLKKENRNQTLPANLPEEQVKLLPEQPGVYYFHDVKGKVMYVGKAKNLKKRVVSHFAGLDTSQKRQEFLRKIHTITHTVCPSEFIACLLESVEIKRLWPIHNKSQKRYEQLWGIYQFEDGRGYLRLAIDKKIKHSTPLASFAMLADAHRFLWKMVKEFELHPTLCFLDSSGSQSELPEQDSYNARVQNAIEWMASQKETFLIREKEGCVLVEKGKFFGMGTITPETELSLENIKSRLVEYPENEVIRSIIRNYAEKYPGRVVHIG